ncbi:PTS sugar transporter subunit IIA [Nocardioides iriomotensis]|uniref:PTS glucose transporter subunit IIA n=1 Tax=Nocardioides iriomotensis TaxID=715784 RepID=A0A4Q5J072_9ACTN|nr:PTS glucose transporter subunit IIA [Nocardioides iriomotensis]RYU10761.1 PTS glucose transporter subunit IIA [Nocardioides iriomotensis]
MTRVLSPVAGVRQDVSTTPDPVFATGLVGPGAAILPAPGTQEARSPVDGVLAKLYPHAFVVVTDSGPGVLVHLGMDTVRLNGDGFEVLAAEGDRISAGDPVVRWDPSYVERAGHSAVCAVVVLDCPFPARSLGEPGSTVATGSLLFEVDC